MTHGPEHHIEHAEHAAHASHDTFNKNVTMSIAIVAAVLACVTMLGHRSHNDTLRLQGEALSLQAKASIKSTDTANAWAYYQSKNMFNLEAEITLDILNVMAVRDGKQKEVDDMIKGYEGNVEHYTGDKTLAHARKKRAASTSDDEKKDDKKKTEKKAGKLAEAKAEAEDLQEKTKKLLEDAEKKIEESHMEHLKAARLDYGELGLQFAVVLCSLAILTKSRGFWAGGVISAVAGAAVSVTGLLGLFMGGGHH